MPGAIYFVTTCLKDSIPAQGLLDIAQLRERLHRKPIPNGLNAKEWQIRQWKMTFARAEEWLDHRPAARHLQDDRLAAQVVEAIHHFLGIRYDVFAFVVMPSHMHWVFQPREDWIASLISAGENVGQAAWRNVGQAAWPASERLILQPKPARPGSLPHILRTPRERIMHTLKTRTSRECNKHLGRRGTLWQDESYDHCVFDGKELERIILYVENNPVRAGLVNKADDWLFSSAHLRTKLGLAFGSALPRWL